MHHIKLWLSNHLVRNKALYPFHGTEAAFLDLKFVNGTINSDLMYILLTVNKEVQKKIVQKGSVSDMYYVIIFDYVMITFSVIG